MHDESKAEVGAVVRSGFEGLEFRGGEAIWERYLLGL